MSSSMVVLPDPDEFPPKEPRRKKNAATGASAAGVRAFASQMIAFYFRAPAKAFFRTRVDYMAYARAINPRVQSNAPWSWRTTTPGLLAHAVKVQGWSFIPNQVLPPLIANVTVGAVLYTAYLQTLGLLYPPAAHSPKRVYPPPPPSHTFAAGFLAGGIQSFIAAPLDAIQVRFRTSDMLEGRYGSMWHYSWDKLKTIGARGVFAGWTLSFLKDSLAAGIFFSTFEYIKAQSYYGFLTRYYGYYQPFFTAHPSHDRVVQGGEGKRQVIKPHFVIEPIFLLLSGVGASAAQQLVVHPLTEIQNLHIQRLEALDMQAQHLKDRATTIIRAHSRAALMRLYYHAYRRTYMECMIYAKKAGGWRRWLYKGFLWSTLRNIPSTSAGLIVFEIVRRRYSADADAVRIEKDGFDILLA